MTEPGPEAGNAEGRSLIVYDDLVDVKGDNNISELDMERDLHRQRAEKFGVPFVDPGKRRDMRDLSRKERFARPGLHTGIDMLSEEEQARRAQRATRFGTSAQGLTWQAPAPEEENEARRRRAAKFGVEFRPVDASGQRDQDLLESRSEIPPPEVPRRPEALHVYGVDVLSTGEILRYFAAYAPTYVEWLNDSSCNVLFADTGTAQRALMGLGRPIASEDLAPRGDAGCSTAEAALGESAEETGPGSVAEEAVAARDAGEGPAAAPPALSYDRVWFKGADALKHGTRVPLTFRVATVEDVKQTMLNAPSRRLWQDGGGRGRGRGRQPAGRGRGRGRGGEKRSRDGDVEMGDAEAAGDAMDAEEGDRARPGGKHRRRAEEKKVLRPSATMFARAMGDVFGGVVE